jgi:inosine-uridine nucleoside N-ribohydrolase
MESKTLKSPEKLEQRLSIPKSKVSVILDTDTYNEIDDQFAVVYLLLSPEKIDLKCICAAPFLNSRSISPCDGMEKSYKELKKIFKIMKIDPSNMIFRGAENFLASNQDAVVSEASEEIIRQARATDGQPQPLYVLCIGAITNLASAILTAPDIINNIVVIWLGGHPYNWESNAEFNLRQDVAAAQVVFDSGVALIHVPCKNVAEKVKSSPSEMETFVKGQGEIGDYLYESFCAYSNDLVGWTKEIWDLAVPAVLTRPECFCSKIVQAPVLNNDKSWTKRPDRHYIKVVTDIQRDGIFKDFFSKINLFKKQNKRLM